MVDREDVDFRVIGMWVLCWVFLCFVLLCFALEIGIEMGMRIGMGILSGVYMIIMIWKERCMMC